MKKIIIKKKIRAAGWSTQRPITGQRRVSRTGQFLRHGACWGSILLQDVAPGRFIRPRAVSAARGRTEEERGESRNLRSQFMSLSDVADAVETGASPWNLPVCVCVCVDVRSGSVAA